MASVLDRDDVSNIVVGVVRDMEQDPSVTEPTRFEEDLRVDDAAKRGYFPPVHRQITEAGGKLTSTKAADFENADTVGEIVDTVWQDVQQNQDTSA